MNHFLATQFASNQFETERKLANILFGIVALFFCGHILRTVLNIHRYFIMESHSKVIESHPVGNGSCIVPTPFWIQVFTITHYRIYTRTVDDCVRLPNYERESLQILELIPIIL